MSADWHILGAGSIGLLWAAELSKAGYKVCLLSHKAAPYPQQIECDNEAYAVEIQHNSQAHAIKNLLITTKTWQTMSALKAIQQAILPTTRLVLLQNGMANQTWLAENYPHNPVFAAITTDGALRQQAWQVQRTGIGRTVYGAINKAAANIMLDLACDLVLEKSDNIQAALWQKLIMNCCINPLTAIYDCLNGELLQNPKAIEQCEQIIIECLLIAEKQGLGEHLSHIKEQVYAVMQSTAKNSSSMREDVKQKRPSEIDAINGFIVQQGKVFGIPTPVNQHILTIIKGLTS